MPTDTDRSDSDVSLGPVETFVGSYIHRANTVIGSDFARVAADTGLWTENRRAFVLALTAKKQTLVADATRRLRAHEASLLADSSAEERAHSVVLLCRR